MTMFLKVFLFLGKRKRMTKNWDLTLLAFITDEYLTGDIKLLKSRYTEQVYFDHKCKKQKKSSITIFPIEKQSKSKQIQTHHVSLQDKLGL